jgi:hypothetical protein
MADQPRCVPERALVPGTCQTASSSKHSPTAANPLFAGYGPVTGSLPDQKIAVAVATTFGEGAFDEQGNYRHKSFQDISAAIGTHLAPDHPMPTPTS